MNIHIRPAHAADLQGISNVVHSAFGYQEGPVIIQLVNTLLADSTAQPVHAWVASTETRIVGYILFSSAQLRSAELSLPAAILAPLAVHLDYQSQGIGGKLIQQGITQLTQEGVDLAFVLGHPDYYPRYGFRAAGSHALQAPFPIPEQNAPAWMVQELRPGILGVIKGDVVCANALHRPEYWRE
jgi:putative acetyltransferase